MFETTCSNLILVTLFQVVGWVLFLIFMFHIWREHGGMSSKGMSRLQQLERMVEEAHEALEGDWMDWREGHREQFNFLYRNYFGGDDEADKTR